MLDELFDEHMKRCCPEHLNPKSLLLIHVSYYAGVRDLLHTIYEQDDGSDISDLLNTFRLDILKYEEDVLAFAVANGFDPNSITGMQ